MYFREPKSLESLYGFPLTPMGLQDYNADLSAFN